MKQLLVVSRLVVQSVELVIEADTQEALDALRASTRLLALDTCPKAFAWKTDDRMWGVRWDANRSYLEAETIRSPSSGNELVRQFTEDLYTISEERRKTAAEIAKDR